MGKQQVIDPPENKRRVLWEATKSKYTLGTFEEFDAKMNDSGKALAFHRAVSKTHNLGTPEEFLDKIGYKKITGGLIK